MLFHCGVCQSYISCNENTFFLNKLLLEQNGTFSFSKTTFTIKKKIKDGLTILLPKTNVDLNDIIILLCTIFLNKPDNFANMG